MDISGIFNPPASQSVSDAIKGAADATGASFDYLLATAQAESGLNPHAASTTSSARGLYQFIDQTWLATMKRSGASLGYAGYADAIVQTAPSHYEVPDPALRRYIMALRDDPAANAAMAGALTRDNAVSLSGRLGRKATNGELYIAHVLGSAGAAKLTTLAGVAPGAAAVAGFPAAAEANRSIFYDRQGNARSVAEVYGILVGRYDGARTPNAAPVNPAKATIGAPLVIAPAAAAADPIPATSANIGVAGVPGVVSNLAAGAAPPGPAPAFTGLFSDRREPVSQLVQDLWVANPQGAAAPGAPLPASSAASLVAASGSRQLFQIQPAGAGGLFGR
jgi:Transglycosylase SLT domain